MANPPSFEVADVIRRFASPDAMVRGVRLTSAQSWVLSQLAICRTAKLGGHVDECPKCQGQHIAYNSCCNRHCPKCQAKRGWDWTEAQLKNLLPTHYFHVVFTVPKELGDVALQNKSIMYALLFSCVQQTLKELTQDPKYLGAEVGVLAVLHTWTQTLMHHPHVHCVIPGGGLTEDGAWKACRDAFFVPVKVMAAVFRRNVVHALEKLYHKKDSGLQLKGDLERLQAPQIFDQFCADLRTKKWNVYAKRPFGGPEQVMKYLARYTHRVAIGNRRIVDIDDTHVTFRYRTENNGQSTMTLTGPEFLRRFAMHVLPKRLVRIRYFGFLAPRYRKDKLDACRRALEEKRGDTVPRPPFEDGGDAPNTDVVVKSRERQCPTCNVVMVTVEEFQPQRTWTYTPWTRRGIDSS